MYGIFTYIYHKNRPNVGKYTIHGSYGIKRMELSFHGNFNSEIWVSFGGFSFKLRLFCCNNSDCKGNSWEIWPVCLSKDGALSRWCVKWWVFKNKTRIFIHLSYSISSILRNWATVWGVCEPLHVVSFRMGVGLKSSKPTEAQNKKAKSPRQISGTMAFAGLVFATASSIWSLGTWGLVGFSVYRKK